MLHLKSTSVEHNLWGSGIIVEQSKASLSVNFPKVGIKQFSYPRCFETHLHLTDEEKQALAHEEALACKAEQNRASAAKVKAIADEIQSRRRELEIKKDLTLSLRNYIEKATGQDLYPQFLYVKKQLSKLAPTYKTMSKENVVRHPEILTNLENIKCTETPEEILKICSLTYTEKEDSYGRIAVDLP